MLCRLYYQCHRALSTYFFIPWRLMANKENGVSAGLGIDVLFEKFVIFMCFLRIRYRKKKLMIKL